MGTKSILLAVSESQTLAEITGALGAEWEATSVATEEEARAQFESRSFDALLVDFNLGSPDASELLNHVLQKSPGTLRFLFAYEADLALVAAKVSGSPQILPKPVELGSLKNRIESGINDSKPEQSKTEPASAPSDTPKVPSIYSEVLQALGNPNVTNKQVGKIIARDADLKSQVLSLTHSAYMGLPKNITNPAEAVESLGFEAVKALVMALQFLAEHSRLKPSYLSVEQIWQHSTSVGRIARDLVLFETKDRALASQALAAGLLHDLGKVVLATNFDDLYGRVHSLARKQPVALWDIEKEMFGATHGEIGACLVGMWNMPAAIVEAAALHHEPAVGENHELTPLAAVHIANILEHELRPEAEARMVAPVINTPYVNDLGLLQRLPVWRAAFANRSSSKLEEEADTEPTVRLSMRGTRAHTARNQRRWAYASVAAGVIVLATLWLKTEPEFNTPEPVYARSTIAEQTPFGASLPVAESVPAVMAQVTATPSVSEKPTESSVSTETAPAQKEPAAKPEEPVAKPEPAKPVETVSTPTTPAAPHQTEVSTSQPVVTNQPTNTVPAAPVEKAEPEFRLNGIIYSVVRPSAIVNHRTVSVGDHVDGATVVWITPTSVTLQIKGQSKTYELR